MVHCAAGTIPSLIQIFLVFPLATDAGIGGVKLGILTPLFVLIFNTLGWSFPALLFFNQTGVHCIASPPKCPAIRLYKHFTAGQHIRQHSVLPCSQPGSAVWSTACIPTGRPVECGQLHPPLLATP